MSAQSLVVQQLFGDRGFLLCGMAGGVGLGSDHCRSSRAGYTSAQPTVLGVSFCSIPPAQQRPTTSDDSPRSTTRLIQINSFVYAFLDPAAAPADRAVPIQHASSTASTNQGLRDGKTGQSRTVLPLCERNTHHLSSTRRLART